MQVHLSAMITMYSLISLGITRRRLVVWMTPLIIFVFAMPNSAFCGSDLRDRYVAAYVAVHGGDLRAAEVLREGADNGDTYAQTALGNLYETGSTITLDYPRAKTLYEAAAAQNYAPAQNLLGRLYARGVGVPKDISRALPLFRQSAIQGYGDAQFHLGFIYCCMEDESDKDYPEAFKWLHKAANQGHASAAHHLGDLYQEGKGTVKDVKMAYFWLKIATIQGESDASRSAQELAKQLTPRQIGELEERIREWKPMQVWREKESKGSE